ncbi:helix-turn-helix domain-containing protein [Patescibacteria group bacterium]|nr:helix-turn-helix domain-containing protein [Patescibacteria group bacterium]
MPPEGDAGDLATLQQTFRTSPNSYFVTNHDGEKIREARDALKLSQEKFAKKAQIARSTLARAEAGETITYDTFKKIADALDMDTHDLLK